MTIADPVNHPAHYSKGRFSIECIEFTRHMTFNAGNAFKYIWRYAEKNGLEDLAKAVVYLRWAIEDGYPAALPGRRDYLSELMGVHVHPRVRMDEPYWALGLVVGDCFNSALIHTQASIEHLERLMGEP